jgi:hypothetical protein
MRCRSGRGEVGMGFLKKASLFFSSSLLRPPPRGGGEAGRLRAKQTGEGPHATQQQFRRLPASETAPRPSLSAAVYYNTVIK